MNVSNRKDKYIDKAIIVLKRDGLRLSLDEIATKIGVTKKTLYNHFSSKEELLKECIRSISSDFRYALSKLDDPHHSPIENMRCTFFSVTNLFMVVNPVFFSDLMRDNPNQAMLEHVVGSGFFKQKIEANLSKGIEDGIYREDLDIEFVGSYMSYSIFGFYINGIVNSNPLIPKTYFEDILEYHLRAITSDKGKKIIDNNYGRTKE
ncbi:TetR/AcrR family transcriptional regulator [Porphyromonas levii]|uniref:TetR/AcrR family transcriptional regulator n=1 Tax=Porphyromonas levii TaxID=28114 RepID=UPI001B8B693D|nr:TetR/AcrR family transcriptional regulator [Porphyromonas levii]MBR8770024.1 hypothetical protein [Porphyromonas levii]